MSTLQKVQHRLPIMIIKLTQVTFLKISDNRVYFCFVSVTMEQGFYFCSCVRFILFDLIPLIEVFVTLFQDIIGIDFIHLFLEICVILFLFQSTPFCGVPFLQGSHSFYVFALL